jgi:hypothetical protein
MPNTLQRHTTMTPRHHQHACSIPLISLYWRQRQAFKKPLEVLQNHFQMNIWQLKSLLQIGHVFATSCNCQSLNVEMIYLTVNNVSCEQSI